MQAGLSALILLASQIKSSSVIEAYQIVVDAAIILYFIPFLTCLRRSFGCLVALIARPTTMPRSYPVDASVSGSVVDSALPSRCWALRVLAPPADSADKWFFELRLVGGTAFTVLIGLALYWRGARRKLRAEQRSARAVPDA